MVHVPYAGESKKSQPVMACVKHAAENVGCSEWLAAKVMSIFLDEVCEQVSKGNTVRIPGFGCFGVNATEPDDGGPERHYPAFSAARGLRNQMFFNSMCNPREAALGANAARRDRWEQARRG